MAKRPFLGDLLLKRGTAESGALKANALPGGGKRLSARAVKAAGLAFIEAKRRALTEQAGGSGAGFSQEGQRDEKDKRNLY